MNHSKNERKPLSNQTILKATLAALILFPLAAFASIIEASPNQACAFLEGHGLATRGWKLQYEGVYGCSSPYKDLGAGNPLTNNLAYYVDGSAGKAEKLKLILNVNNRAEASSSQRELFKAAKTLCLKATGKELPQLVAQAISAGKKAASKVGSSSLEVIRIDWPTGKGFELKFIIE
jgi:hypothetical protein